MANAVNVFPAGFRITDASGAPILGAYVEFFDAGTTDEKVVYSDKDLTLSLGFTVYCDSGGYPVAGEGSTTKVLVYTNEDPFKIVIYDGDDVVIATHDDVVGAVVPGTGGGGSSGITQAQADVRYIRNANALAAATNIENADLMPFWSITGAANKGITYTNFRADVFGQAAAEGASTFPVGTRLVFQQTTPPTGWTKETGAAYDDAVLRFETGTVSTGGTVAFATVFANKTLTGTVGATTLTVNQIPSHNHYTTRNTASAATALSTTNTLSVSDLTTGTVQDYVLRGVAGAANVGLSSDEGGGASHTHSLTMTAEDFRVKYVGACIGQKS